MTDNIIVEDGIVANAESSKEMKQFNDVLELKSLIVVEITHHLAQCFPALLEPQ